MDKEKLFGLFGNPVSHSLSPVIHRAAYQAMNLHACYHAFLIHNLAKAVEAIRHLSLAGVSVTIPFKEEVIPYLDEIDDEARHIKAVNTIVNREGKLLGFNTDARGFIQALREVENPAGKRVALLGAGGAARAVAYALKKEGAEVIITNRTRTRAERLAEEFSCTFFPWEEKEKLEAEILVNTTSVGMYPHTDALPFPQEALHRFELVVDIIYHPWETKLLRYARKRGCRTLNGGEMFVHQGAEQIRLWTGLEPPTEVMRKALKEALFHGP